MVFMTIALLGGIGIFAVWYMVCEAPRAPRGTPGICRFCKCTREDPCYRVRMRSLCQWDDHGRTVCTFCAEAQRSVVSHA